jgi:hypothetical protein
MRMDLEAEAIAAAQEARPLRPAVPTLGDMTPGAGQLGAPNRSW